MGMEIVVVDQIMYGGLTLEFTLDVFVWERAFTSFTVTQTHETTNKATRTVP